MFTATAWRAALRIFVSTVLATASVGNALAQRPVRFNEQIRPILSDRCFACHGPDSKRREADLRIDTREGATQARDGGAAIVVGQPDQSQLIARVTAADADLRMPPADSNKAALTLAEAALVRRWIAEGAEYEDHWSLLPMKRPEPPRVPDDQAARLRTPIDAFVLEKIGQHDLGSLAPDAGASGCCAA